MSRTCCHWKLLGTTPAITPIWAPGVDTDLGAVPNARLADMPLVEVTGMFDHPDAQTCRNRPNTDEPHRRRNRTRP